MVGDTEGVAVGVIEPVGVDVGVSVIVTSGGISPVGIGISVTVGVGTTVSLGAVLPFKRK